MGNRDVVVIGASAGGIEALQKLLPRLPGDFAAAVLVVLHTTGRPGSLLPQILGRSATLPVSHPADRTRLERGHIYVAPPDCHMLVEGGMVRVLQGPRENLHRPAIDPLFRSAAVAAGRRVIGVILTGMLDDGTSGLMVVRAHGGAAIVQDPETALFPSMPENALEQVPQAKVLALEAIAAELVRLVTEELPAEERLAPARRTTEEKESEFLERQMPQMDGSERPGEPSAFACPDCGGVLWELEEHGFLRFRCRVGHAFTAKHLSAEQRRAIETALWAGLRALEESAALYHRLAARGPNGRAGVSTRFQEHAENRQENARVLRDFLVHVNEGVEEMAGD
ncbi:MAG TPA: chemotaxis protein CheB [Acidobacteriaceae bacterium]|nr:chemotaxis protein CheB [Acidobacteriaceae bacterium]